MEVKSKRFSKQDISINFGLNELCFGVTCEGTGAKLGPLLFKFGDPLIGGYCTVRTGAGSNALTDKKTIRPMSQK